MHNDNHDIYNDNTTTTTTTTTTNNNNNNAPYIMLIIIIIIIMLHLMLHIYMEHYTLSLMQTDYIYLEKKEEEV